MARRQSRPKAQPKADSRWITVREPFNYTWASRAVTHFHTPGEYRVKNEVADEAVKRGYATEGKATGGEDAKAADTGRQSPVGDEDAAGADRPADRTPVDPDAG